MNFKTWYEQHRSNPNWAINLKKLDEPLYKKVASSVGDRWAEKAYTFINQLSSRPVCRCGAERPWYGRSYALRCSVRCSNIETASFRATTLKARSEEQKKKVAAKARATSIERYGEDYATARAKKRSASTISRTENARKKSMLIRYGVSNPAQLEEAQQKRKLTYSKRTDEQREATRLKNFATRCARGISLPNDHPSIFKSKKSYTRRVRYLTNVSVKQHGLFSSRSREQHVDHIFSVLDGYRHHVSPEVLAHPANLRLLCASNNSRKNSRSDITIDELFARIEHCK